jgi:PilZ domain/Flagellar protein YcgR
MTDATAHKREDFVAKLDMGTIIHISNEDNSLKYRTALVGCHQETLITSLPNSNQLPDENATYTDFFIEKNTLIARLIKAGFVYAFKSVVQAINTDHCKLLLSSIPEEVQARPLRQTVRYPCALQAGLIIGETKYRGAVTNVSLTGCLLRMKHISNRAQLDAMKSNKLPSTLEIKFPFNQKTKALQVYVKSINEESEGYLLVGMEFIDDTAIVHQYIESMQLEELTEFLPFNE